MLITTNFETIKIYNKTYEVPVLASSNFASIQESINQRQALVSTGKRSTKLFGLISKKEEIDFESRFKELEALIADYNFIIGFLNQHKEAYQQFFLELTAELKELVRLRCSELAQAEMERLELEKEVEDDEILLGALKNQQQQIFKNAFILHQAAQLMLLKVELINKSIQRLAEDQEQQKELLEAMIGKLQKYRKTYALQQKINKIERDIRSLADTAINFEQYLNDFLSPFQGLIDQVVRVDSELTRTVEEIKILAEDIVNPNITVINTNSNFSNSIVEFLVASTNKQDHIGQTLQQIRSSNISSIDELLLSSEVLEVTNLSKALSSIQNGVSEQLTQFHKSLSSSKTASLIEKLKKYLEQRDWRKADKTTQDILLILANRTESGWLRVEDIKNLPIESLREIDQLWHSSSEGRFGFSVQADIYRQLGDSTEFDNFQWLTFGQYVGWRCDGKWPDYNELNFQLLRTGQLPLLGIAGDTPRFTVFFWSRLISFAQKITENNF